VKVAVINLKGGTGKTTTAVYLASGLSARGRTLLVDADPQGSAFSWSERAPDLAFTTVALPSRDLYRRVTDLARGFDHVVIDTPPGDAGLVRCAALAVDTVVVPLPTGLVDLDRLTPTLEVLADVQPYHHSLTVQCILTRVRRGTKSAEAARRLIAELRLPTLPAEIALRENYSTSFGLAPRDLNEYGAVVTALLQPVRAP